MSFWWPDITVNVASEWEDETLSWLISHDVIINSICWESFKSYNKKLCSQEWDSPWWAQKWPWPIYSKIFILKSVIKLKCLTNSADFQCCSKLKMEYGCKWKRFKSFDEVISFTILNPTYCFMRKWKVDYTKTIQN